MASARNWKRISRLVAPIALRTPISRMREVIRPHGYAIYRVMGYGFVLVEEEENILR